MLTSLAYYVHDLNPIIFSVGPVTPRWYGFAYLMGFLGAYVLLLKLQRDGMLRMGRERVPDMVLNGCIFGVLVGGRLGYCLFYQPSLLRFTPEFPYWGVLKVWDGGMSAHGGVVFTILALVYFAWWTNRKIDAAKASGLPLPTHDDRGKPYGANFWQRLSIINIGDAACMVVPVGLCFGRIANFINGELYGHVSYVPWAVKFPSEIYAPTNNHIDPEVQGKLPAVIAKVFGIGDWMSPAGFDTGLRMLSTRLRARDPEALRRVAEILEPRHPSQLYEALLEGVLLFAIVWLVGRLWRKDGMASGAFLTFYPVMRIIGEQFRVGDTPELYFGVPVSLGVVYSVPMVVAGAVFWGYWIRRDRRVEWKRVEGGGGIEGTGGTGMKFSRDIRP